MSHLLHHQSSSHNDSECRAIKKKSATMEDVNISTTPVASGSNTEGSSASYWNPSNPKPSGTNKKCFKCGADNWRLGHRCSQNTSSNSVTPPTHAFRAMSMSPTSSVSSAASSSDASTSSGPSTDATSSAAAPTSKSIEDEEMDLADALVAEAAQACKKHQNLGYD
ncbi:hypothetical protein G6F56_012917 [Rhizopus delemar]|nr:hypothetical protein G6F56_012917 [Rhizopus delemar]